ncbi:MAG: DNA primase [Psychromonas sp.]|nr:DNA primase [Psychromonas sp.]
MAGRIPKYFIDDLLARTDIVDVIESRIKLKKNGKSYRASCPFHNGNNKSSFSVNSEAQFYHCFNCGANGNVLSFLMEYDGIEFVDAIESLADQLSVNVIREEETNYQSHPTPYVDRKDMYLLMADIMRFYQQQLRHHVNSAKVINYLKSRGLSGETVKHFKIGYSPPGWDELRKRYATSSELELQLVESGVLISKSVGVSAGASGSYDRFRDRLMFPIIDRRGRVCGFGGRVLDNQEPKYLNSPETPIFHKGKELYGLYQVKQAHKDIQRILVTEGYMDVVALQQFGIDYAVASLGTATTPDHIKLLFRSTSEIVCCFDGDKAGKDAAWRALNNALGHLQDGRMLRFMFLADGEDPDSFIQKEGKSAFELLVENAQPLSDFLFEQILSQVDMRHNDSKSKLAQLAIPLISKLQATVFREMMEEKLTKLLGIEKEGLKKLLPAASILVKPKKQKSTPMRLAISILLQHPKLAFSLPLFPEFKIIDLPGINLLCEILDICRARQDLSTGQLLENWRDKPEYSNLSKLAIWNNDVEEDKHEDVFFDILENFLTIHIKTKIEKLKLKERSGKILSSIEKKELVTLLMEQ